MTNQRGLIVPKAVVKYKRKLVFITLLKLIKDFFIQPNYLKQLYEYFNSLAASQRKRSNRHTIFESIIYVNKSTI